LKNYQENGQLIASAKKLIRKDPEDMKSKIILIRNKKEIKSEMEK
jgi:hypothetical protein